MRQIFFHVQAADIVDLADAPAFENRENAAAIILHMQPVALLLSVAVDRQRLVVESVGDHQGKKFFRKLVGP